MPIRRKPSLRSRFARKLQRRTTEPVAVVGMGCRFPGAPSLDSYRRLLAEGANARREVPPDRWDIDAYYSPERGTPGTMSTRYGGFIDDIDRFDAGFFRLTPREAEAMDPQHRLLLEVAWEAFEAAAIPPARIAGTNTGVYVGVSTFDYADLIGHRNPDGYTNTGLAHSAAVGRLSYFFDLKGPCEAIDTACSASLVAVHNACRSLRAQEVDCALAGGVNAIISPDGHIGFSQAGMMAPDGRCKTFDARADGYARSEGCGLVVLKRLADARRDGDLIHAVITGSAVNHDGRSQGFTAPNGRAQQDVVQRAWRSAGHAAQDIDYVEAHGTGTALGDPQELFALGRVFRERASAGRVAVASAKTNLGHLEAAAGVAGLIKLVLMIRDAELFPHLHLQQVNPDIDLRALPLHIPTERRPWPTRAGQRVGGVSSFGFSGTNAHLTVASAPANSADSADSDSSADSETNAGPDADEQASRDRQQVQDDAASSEPEPAPLPARSTHVLTLSARTSASLARLAGRWARHLREHVSDSIADVAFTSNTGRAHLDRRAAVVASSRPELVAGLRALRDGAAAKNLFGPAGAATPEPKLAFLFTGQGAQYPGMGKALYESEPVFRAALDACAEHLRPHLPRPLLEVMFAAEDDATIHETHYAQPALVALAYATCQLWESFGVTPWAVLGHSVGEIAAACVAGTLSLEDALTLAATRGQLMQAQPQTGAMISVGADRARIDQVVEDVASASETAAALAAHRAAISIAAVNGPHSTVISGPQEAARAVAEALQQAGVKTRSLTVSHAFHSALMEPMLDPLEAAAGAFASQPPRVRWFSTLTGAAFAAGEHPDQRYWRRQARAPVLFEQGMRALADAGATGFLEIGPQPMLINMARMFLDHAQSGDEPEPRLWLASMSRDGDDTRCMLESAAALYARTGAGTKLHIDWERVHERRPLRRTAGPTYPFERKRFWLAEALSAGPRVSSSARSNTQPSPGQHPLLGRRLPSALATAQFEAMLGANTPAYLSDHRIYGLPVFPATGYIELALAAVHAVAGEHPCELTDVRIERALILPEDDRLRRVQVLLAPAPAADGEDSAPATHFTFEIHSQPLSQDDPSPAAPWLLHARGHARVASDTSPLTGPTPDTAEQTRARLEATGDAREDDVDVAEYYHLLADRGMRYTGLFQALSALRRGPYGSGTAVARAALPAESPADHGTGHVAHPALVDACLQAIGVALTTKFSAGGAIRMAYLPVAIERVTLHSALGQAAYSTAAIHLDPSGLEYSAEVSLFTSAGAPALDIAGLRMQGVERSRMRDATSERQHSGDILHTLKQAAPDARRDLMTAFVSEQAADIMGLDPAELDDTLMYFELGMSSLGSVELLYRIQKNLRCEIPTNMMLDYESTDTLATHLLAQLFGADAPTADDEERS